MEYAIGFTLGVVVTAAAFNAIVFWVNFQLDEAIEMHDRIAEMLDDEPPDPRR